MRRAAGRLAGLAAAAVVLLAGCSGDDDDRLSRGRRVPDRPAESGEVEVERPRGGSARVAVWGEPDPAAPTLGGAAVRALVLPQLFVVGPDGSWEASLVEPGSDRLARDGLRATFRLRRGAVWSDGSPITASDLRRSADARFVASVDGPAADGTITLRFTQPLPGWRRLWSGADAVAPPAEGVWGGPFVVAGRTPGLETVLRRNDRWWGPGPFLDEVRLVLVPSQFMAVALFERGEVDVVMPMPDTARIRSFDDAEGATVAIGGPAGGAGGAGPSGGWWVGLFLNPGQLSFDNRAAVVATVDRDLFVGTLLKEEATVLDGFAGPTWKGVGPGRPGFADALDGDTVSLVGTIEEPMTALLQRAMQKPARAAGGRLELRNAEAHQVAAWLAAGDYGALVMPAWDPPEPCWTCRWSWVSDEAAALARDADAGDGAAAERLEALLRDEALLLPLWQGPPVVASRGPVEGVEPNAWALSAAWNAWEWWIGSG